MGVSYKRSELVKDAVHIDIWKKQEKKKQNKIKEKEAENSRQLTGLNVPSLGHLLIFKGFGKNKKIGTSKNLGRVVRGFHFNMLLLHFKIIMYNTLDYK